MAFKRKRTYAPRRAAFKRRRPARARRSRRSRIRAYAGNDKPYSYPKSRSRRLSRRAFKSLLWRQTITATKYKSILSQAGTVATPASYSNATTTAMWALGLYNASTSPFFTSAGGLNPLSSTIPTITDPTETTAQFDSDIIVRGGLWSFEVYNNTETADVSNDLIRCKIVLVRTPQTRDDTIFQANLLPGQPAQYISADQARKVGKIILEKDFVIKDAESVKVEFRIPCQKIDVGSYMNEFKAYIVYLCVANGFDTVAQTVRYRMNHNIAFCGDAST